MPQQLSNIGFGSDATTLSGYALRLNDRFGAVDLNFENVGQNTATLFVREFLSGFPTSSYPTNALNYAGTILGAPISIAPSCVTTKHLVTASQQIGIFGSGNTQVNITIMLRNPADRRNPLIECIPIGKQNWGFAPGFNSNAFQGIYPNI
jgi:hypothetical protein